MQKTKMKRGSFWQTQMLPFAIVWAISLVIGTIVSHAFLVRVLYLFFAPEQAAIASFVRSLLVTGLVQVFLVERLLKRSMRGWMLYTGISGLISLFMIHVVAKSYWYQPALSLEFYSLINYAAFIVPTPLIQFFWLRQRVKKAWLWPVISMAILTAFSAVQLDSNYEFIEMIMLMSIGVVQASLMHYLWQQPKDAEKAKIDVASEDEEARIKRLQEQEHSRPLWNRGDDQALQSEA